MIVGKMSADAHFRDRNHRSIGHLQDDRYMDNCNVRPRELRIMLRHISGHRRRGLPAKSKEGRPSPGFGSPSLLYASIRPLGMNLRRVAQKSLPVGVSLSMDEIKKSLNFS